jgi:hypothetical protein
VNELEILRREFDAIPEPDDETVAVVRALVLREIGTAKTPKRRPQRHWLRITAAAGVALAALVAGLFIVHPRNHAGIGTEIAAAAYRALTPPDRIRHEIFRTNGLLTERWATTSAPYAYRETTGGSDSTLGPCGLMFYDRRINLLSVTSTRIRTNTALTYFAFRDPVQQYLAAYRGRHVSYRGKTTFRGVPAYELDVSRRGEVVTSYLVRRDNYYPLRIVSRRGSSKFTTTYARFNYLPRNAETERLLTMRPHLGAFLMHFGGPNTPACKRFGSYDSISGKGLR